jgi:hypothetical protein
MPETEERQAAQTQSGWIGVWVTADYFRPTVVRTIVFRTGFCELPVEHEPHSHEMIEAIERLGGNYISGQEREINFGGKGRLAVSNVRHRYD